MSHSLELEHLNINFVLFNEGLNQNHFLKRIAHISYIEGGINSYKTLNEYKKMKDYNFNNLILLNYYSVELLEFLNLSNLSVDILTLSLFDDGVDESFLDQIDDVYKL